MNIPIDWGTVSWGYVALMSGFAFLSGLIGNVLSFRNHFVGAILTAVLFAVIYVAWTYYLVPQGFIPANFVPAVTKAA
ncbi:MAG: hypothetical protein ABSG76_14155 [Xanthobacteraceae bacterium]|jgi:uncharacterized BrkB/YihY/UPF0761 family membrane protein